MNEVFAEVGFFCGAATTRNEFYKGDTFALYGVLAWFASQAYDTGSEGLAPYTAEGDLRCVEDGGVFVRDFFLDGVDGFSCDVEFACVGDVDSSIIWNF